MVDAAGVKVGIIGVMTLRALSATMAANVSDLAVLPLADAIAAQAKSLRAQGADVVIVTAHAGGRCKAFDRPTDLSSCEANAEILGVARDLPRSLVDVIVAGHSHAGMAHQAHGIAIIESFSGGRSFGRVDLTVDRASKRITQKRIFPPQDLCAEVHPTTRRCDATGERRTSARGSRVRGPRRVARSRDCRRSRACARDGCASSRATQLGVVLDTPIRSGSDTESPLGNLFTDVLLQAVPGAELSINNTFGGLRADLPEGPLTYGRLFETFPFDNMLVHFRLTGAELRRMFADRLQQSR